jgi:hypothetical protein
LLIYLAKVEKDTHREIEILCLHILTPSDLFHASSLSYKGTYSNPPQCAWFKGSYENSDEL